jgi:hypothetical protein
MNYKSIFIVGLLLSIASSSFAGGPWPLQKGKSYLKVSEWWIVFDRHYTDAGVTDPNVTTGIYNTFLYGEYGLTDKLDIGINAALFSRNYMNNLVSGTTGEVLVPGEALNSVGDIDISFKYGLTKPGASFPIAVSLTLGLPTGKAVGGTQGNLQTGDGEFNQMIRIDGGKSFKIGEKTNAYATVYLGYNNRTNSFSDEIRYGLELGVNLLNEKLWFVSRLFGVESMKNGDTTGPLTSTSIFANNSAFTSFSLEANYYLTQKFGFSVNAATAFRGEIIAAAPTYSVGFFLDLSK